MGIRRTLHYASASSAKSSIFFSLGTQEWLVWHSQGLPDTFRVARYLPMVEMTRKTAGKRAIFGEKNEKMTVMRLSIECQKIPSYGSMATLRPFHFWKKQGSSLDGSELWRFTCGRGGSQVYLVKKVRIFFFTLGPFSTSQMRSIYQLLGQTGRKMAKLWPKTYAIKTVVFTDTELCGALTGLFRG